MIVSLLHFSHSIRSIGDPIVIASNDSSNFHIEERGEVKLLIHGWNADAEHTSMQPVRNAYLRLNVSHVVAADWREIAAMPYIFARDLIGVIGRRICELLKGFVARVKVNPERIHIVGHSLGTFLGFLLKKGFCFSDNLKFLEGFCWVLNFKAHPSDKINSSEKSQEN